MKERDTSMPSAVRLPEALEKRLDALVARTHRSKSYYLRRALETYIEDYEDYLLALEVKKRVDAGQEKTYTLEEVKEKLGL